MRDKCVINLSVKNKKWKRIKYKVCKREFFEEFLELHDLLSFLSPARRLVLRAEINVIAYGDMISAF